MARIAGVNIPDGKHLEISLTHIHGIGSSRARLLCTRAELEGSRRVLELNDQELQRLRNLISDMQVEGDLRRQVAQNIKRLKDLGCYRGLRHRRGLPVRGQRTRTNARTRKGPSKPMRA